MFGGTKDRFGNTFTRDYARTVLGITADQTVTSELIQKQYHKKARQTHPDKNRNDPDAKEKFQEVKNAHDFLNAIVENPERYVKDPFQTKWYYSPKKTKSTEEKERDSREEWKARFNILFKYYRSTHSAQSEHASTNDPVKPATITFFLPIYMTEKKSSLVLTNEKTIADLKYNYLMINKAWNQVNNDPPIVMVHFYLDYADNELDNEKPLDFYGIQDGSDIVVDLNLAEYFSAMKEAFNTDGPRHSPPRPSDSQNAPQTADQTAESQHRHSPPRTDATQPAESPHRHSHPRPSDSQNAPQTADQTAESPHRHSPPRTDATQTAEPQHRQNTEPPTQPSVSEEKRKKSYFRKFLSYFSYSRDPTKKSYLSRFLNTVRNPFKKTKKGGNRRMNKSRKMKTLQR